MRPKLLTAVALGAAWIVACGSFSGDDPPPDPTVDAGDAGQPDANAPPDASVDAPHDAARGGSLCPASRPPGCELAGCTRRVLWAPPDVEYPFAITTDAASVYWVAQGETDAADAYNGTGVARVLRARKNAMAGEASFEISAGQVQTTSIALDGDYVYWWAIAGSAGGAGALRRARRDCDVAPCAVDDVLDLGPGRVRELLRVAPGKLLVASEDGQLRIADVNASPAVAKVVATAGAFPSVSATNDAVYATDALGGYVQKYDLASGAFSPQFAALPVASNQPVSGGMAPSTTDCKAVWGTRATTTGRDLLRVGLDRTPTTEGSMTGPFDNFWMAADRRYVYFANANGGGVYAWDTKPPDGGKQPPIKIAGGNVWHLAVDDDGVYWGDHAGMSSGTIHMLSK